MTQHPQGVPKPTGTLPGWLPTANRVLKWLQRRGLKMGTVRLLAVPGRISGEMHSTPISVLTVDGVEYTIAGLDDADWVRNLRVSVWGELTYGRSRRKARFVELPVDQREPILRAFPVKVPQGTGFFKRLYGVESEPDQFATLVDRCPVFRIEDMPPETGA
jgi:hypothetical protein